MDINLERRPRLVTRKGMNTNLERRPRLVTRRKARVWARTIIKMGEEGRGGDGTIIMTSNN